MKKLISLALVLCMVLSCFAVSASAYGWTDPDIYTVDEAVEEHEFIYGEEVPTNRYYFLMPNGSNGDLGDDDSVDPETGEPVGHPGEYAKTWYIPMADGTLSTQTAGIYWWESEVADPAAWVGYLPSGEDAADPNVYYADVPQAVTTIIWNNAVDGGMDETDPIYYCAAQSINIPCEYYDPGESPNYPDGTDSFDNMIFVVDPDLISEAELSGKQTCGGEWYYYYGNGCYGFTKDGTEADCLRDDHYDANGNHVVPKAEKPTAAPVVPTETEAPTPTETEAPAPTETEPPEIPTETEAPKPTETEAPKPTEAPGPETVTGELHFDTTTAGWGTVSKVFCHIWAYDGDAFAKWQSKKEACTDADGDGIWTYDIGGKGFELEVGKLYAVIFSSGDNQTYDLLFDSTVLGDTAYCDGTIYENPEDSSKKAQAAFWRGQDADEFGPEKKITSIGNVVGTCIPNITTAQEIFETFLADTEKLENVRTFSLKEDQAILDDIAKGLGLTKEDVEEAIANTGADVAWTVENSTIGAEPEFDLGDVNGDGTIDVMDATAIQVHTAKLDTLTDAELKRADTTKDGSVDIMDATRIQQFIAKLITEF